MVSRDFVKLVEQLAQQVVEAKDTRTTPQRNEEWTKMNFILPLLLDGLGWDRWKDVDYEVSPSDVEGALDLVLLGPPRIGIEAKALDVPPPKDRSHPQIKKGLTQSEERGASYFIWTNGDCWQFFSLALPDAPMYSLTLSNARGDHEQIEQIANQFHFLERGAFSAGPERFDEAIRENWKTAALPAAFDALLHERTYDLLELIRRDLPSELDIKDEEILTFFEALKLPSALAGPAPRRGRPDEKTFPEDWQRLLDRREPQYSIARKRFRGGYYRKLGQYLIGDQYSPWSKKTTWIHADAPNVLSEKKKIGNVVHQFKKWHFIEWDEWTENYHRVEDSIPFLRKLLDEPMKP